MSGGRRTRLWRKINYKIGLIAEFIAALYLRCKFYNIIAQRYKCYFGELDIIAIRGNKIVFIEVKKRATHDMESISSASSKRIYNSASFFLSKNALFENYEVSIDLIQLNRFLIPKHFENYINW